MDFEEQEEVGGSVPQQRGMIRDFEEESKLDRLAESLENNFYLSMSQVRQQK